MFTGLATKYRPKKFRQVIGQPDIPVIKSVLSDKVSLPPLLLFCGPSGVGKTTTARIIASFLNCTSIDSSGEPCSKCDACKASISGQLTNVYELDAASHGTADQLRELVVKAHLSSPTAKLFILDEAQSISAQGWNVLLKVLEEPPQDCLFILVTSEPKKVPPKVRTRALRFNFRPLSPTKMKWYLAELARHCNMKVSGEDLDIIASMSEGSVREALMMLDQCNSSGKTAKELFSDKDLSFIFFNSILEANYASMLEVIDRWWGEVGDCKVIMSQLAVTLENIVLKKSGSESLSSIDLSTYGAVVDSLTSDQIVDVLLTVSDWFPLVYAKPQLVMLASKLYKSINGDNTVIQEKVAAQVSQNQKLPKSALSEKFSSL